MSATWQTLESNHPTFKQQYTQEQALMQKLSQEGQAPSVMVIACCDSRVDPALLLRADPGDCFVVRSVANRVPAYSKGHQDPSTSAALEYGVCHLNITDLVIMGHSQCGGIHARFNIDALGENDFIAEWIEDIDCPETLTDPELLAKAALKQSYQNALSFPWIQTRHAEQSLNIHLRYVNIATGDLEVVSP